MTGRERIKEILDTRCFETLKDKMGTKEFVAWALEKIIPIQGDLTLQKLGMIDKERDLIINECEIVINSAASTKFNEPLHITMNTNYFGSIRMLELAKSCKKIQAYCHLSTAYVNSNLPHGTEVDEEVYN